MKFMILCSTYYVFSCMKQNKIPVFLGLRHNLQKRYQSEKSAHFQILERGKNKYDLREGHLFIKCAIQ